MHLSKAFSITNMVEIQRKGVLQSNITCVTVVSLGDALRWGEAGNLMLSCLARHLRCKCDLILFLTGVGSARWHLWAVVLDLLVL